MVVIEFNPTVPNHVYFVQEENISIQQGSSLLALQTLGKELGYTLVATTIFNGIFLRNDLMGSMPPSVDRDPDICSLHQPTMTTDIFQTYDGELKLVGAKKLFWHKIAINPQKIQMLSKKDRRFPFSPPDGWTSQLETCRQAADELIALLSTTTTNCPDAGNLPFVDPVQRFIDACKNLLSITCMEGLVVEQIVRVVGCIDAETVECYHNRSLLPNRNAPVFAWYGLVRLSLASLFDNRGDSVMSSGDDESVRWYRLALVLLDLPLFTTGFSMVPAPGELALSHQHMAKLSNLQGLNVWVVGQCYSLESLRDISSRYVRITLKIARLERIKGGENGLHARNLLCKAASCLAFILELPSLPASSSPASSPSSAAASEQGAGSLDGDVLTLFEMYSKEYDKQRIRSHDRGAAISEEAYPPLSVAVAVAVGEGEGEGEGDRDERYYIVDMVRRRLHSNSSSCINSRNNNHKAQMEALRAEIARLDRQNRFLSWCVLGYTTAIVGGSLIVLYLHKTRR